MKKITGSYYTPKRLADFIVKYLCDKTSDINLSILEPSVGDGVFVDALSRKGGNNLKNAELTIVDINTTELAKAKRNAKSTNYFKRINAVNQNFLSIDHRTTKHSLIIGNPPYIKKKSLSSKVISSCEKCHNDAQLSSHKINNIWTAFIVSSAQQLRDDGIMALVLPSDLLQVKYAEEIRLFLERNFSRLEIFSLDADTFPGIEQQTIVLFAFKKHSEKGTFFFKISDYESCKVTQISSNGLMISQSKWTHYNLSSSEIKLLNSIKEKLPQISDFVNVRAGIVTGANKFFILPKNKVQEHGAQAYSLPILPNSRFVKHGADFTLEDFETLSDSSKPTFLLDLERKTRKNKKLDAYLAKGKDLLIHERYKCALRNQWFHVPNIGTPPEAFFFKRTHLVPKVIRNPSNVYVTDTAYKIDSKTNTNIKSFVRSFYTIITFIYAELMGRKYGGGVLELTPNEFKKLPIFYWDTTDKEYDIFSQNVSFSKTSYDWLQPAAFKSQLNLKDKQLLELEHIYSRLIASRIR